MKRILIAVFPLAALVACATKPVLHPEATTGYPSDESPGRITVVSEPPGVMIEINGLGIGKTPCRGSVPVMFAGGKWVLRESLAVTALPGAKGEAPQTRIFEKYGQPPVKVSFDMLHKTAPVPMEKDPYIGI